MWKLPAILTLCVLFGGTGVSAPPPRVKDKAQKQESEFVRPGAYSLKWGEADWSIRFYADGTCLTFLVDDPFTESYQWVGFWKWNPKTKHLTVEDNRKGDLYKLDWSVTLDKKGRGAALWSTNLSHGTRDVQLARE